MAARSHGFWPGFLTGVVLAALIGVALAVLVPRPPDPPAIDPAALDAPAAPEAPADAEQIPVPETRELIRPPATAPLIGERPAADAPPDPAGLGTPNETLERGPAEDASLVPVENE